MGVVDSFGHRLWRINFMGCSLALVLETYTKSSKSVFQCNATITSMVFRNFAFYNKANQVHWLLKLGDSQGVYIERRHGEPCKFLFLPKMGLLGSQANTKKIFMKYELLLSLFFSTFRGQKRISIFKLAVRSLEWSFYNQDYWSSLLLFLSVI